MFKIFTHEFNFKGYSILTRRSWRRRLPRFIGATNNLKPISAVSAQEFNFRPLLHLDAPWLAKAVTPVYYWQPTTRTRSFMFFPQDFTFKRQPSLPGIPLIPAWIRCRALLFPSFPPGHAPRTPVRSDTSRCPCLSARDPPC